MKTLIKSLIILAAALLDSQITQGQGTTYLSNIGQASTGSIAVGSDSWQAAEFISGNNASGYVLNSVQLGMTDASGNPSGFTAMLYGYNIYDNGGFSPGSSLGTLSGSANPATAGVFTFTDVSSITLSPNTPYYIVLTAGTAVANGAYDWSLAGTFSYNPSGGWGIPHGIAGAGFYSSSNGIIWNGGQGNLQFAINATAVPEPGVTALFVLGGLGLLWHRRRAKAVG